LVEPHLQRGSGPTVRDGDNRHPRETSSSPTYHVGFITVATQDIRTDSQQMVGNLSRRAAQTRRVLCQLDGFKALLPSLFEQGTAQTAFRKGQQHRLMVRGQS